MVCGTEGLGDPPGPKLLAFAREYPLFDASSGHIGAALLVYSPLGLCTILLADSQLAFVGAIVAGVLAMLPDIDMRIPLLTHRGPTHTVWFALIVGAVLAALGGQRGAEASVLAAVGGALFGLLLGIGTVASHIAADALTPAGVQPFWPLRDTTYTYDLARASNPLVNYALLGVEGGGGRPRSRTRTSDHMRGGTLMLPSKRDCQLIRSRARSRTSRTASSWASWPGSHPSGRTVITSPSSSRSRSGSDTGGGCGTVGAST